jgi:hypothetical protein
MFHTGAHESNRSGGDEVNTDRLLSRLLSWFAMGLALLLPVLVAVMLVVFPAKVLAAAQIPTIRHLDPSLLALSTRVFVVAIALLPVLAMCRALWIASRCFRDFGEGNYFVRANVLRLRDFARWMLIAVVLGILATPALSFILTRSEGTTGSLQISLSSSQLVFLVFAGLVWQISRVFARAVALAEEHAQFV